jgi:hypothetical protein
MALPTEQRKESAMYRSYLLESVDAAEHMREVQARCQRKLMLRMAKADAGVVEARRQTPLRSRLSAISHFLTAAFAR